MTGILDYLRRPDVRNALAMGFNAMSTRPDPYLNSMLQTRMENQRLAAGRQAAMEYLKGKAGAAPYIAAINAGMTGPDAISAHTSDRVAMTGVNASQTEKHQEVYNNGTYVQYFANGSRKVFLADGQEVFGADALEAINAGRQSDIDYAGQEVRSKEAAKQVSTLLGDTLKNIATSESTLANLDKALKAVESGAYSGLLFDYLPNINEQTAQLANARTSLGLDIIGSVTFGALSAPELKLALETALPTSLSGELLKDYIIRKKRAIEKLRIASVEKARALSRTDVPPEQARKEYIDLINQKQIEFDRSNQYKNMNLSELNQIVAAIANGTARLTPDERLQIIARLEELQ